MPIQQPNFPITQVLHCLVTGISMQSKVAHPKDKEGQGSWSQKCCKYLCVTRVHFIHNWNNIK